MIVRAEGDSLQLIRQPDHARLAGAIMAHCVPLAARERRASILDAIAGHDNGWAEEDETPLLDAATGGVYDFVTAPPAVRQRVWPRGIARLSSDPWAAALVAEHADSIYERFHADAEWATFFADVRMLRATLLEQTGLRLEDLVADYTFVRLGDLISLVFCTGWTEEHRLGDVTIRRVGTRVIVTPELFGSESIPLEVPARSIPRRWFHSADDLRDAWNDAATIALRGVLTSNF